MNDQVKYPLEDVLEVKRRRVERAEKVVLEKKKALEEQEKKLRECEKAKDAVLAHKQDKLRQMRDEMDHSTTSPKIQQMKAYLKVVDEKLKQEEKKVQDQKLKVQAAEKELETARVDLRARQFEEDKLKDHKKDWKKQQAKEQMVIEARQGDEAGDIIFMIKQSKKQ